LPSHDAQQRRTAAGDEIVRHIGIDHMLRLRLSQVGGNIAGERREVTLE
jgi:hypothetical protein